MPLIRRLPKRGFNNAAFHKNYAVVNLRDLERFASGSVVNEASLREAKLIRGNFHGIKILGDGELKHGLSVEVDKVSAPAREKIEKAGGTISAPEATRPNGPRQKEQEPAASLKKAPIEKASARKARSTKKAAPK